MTVHETIFNEIKAALKGCPAEGLSAVQIADATGLTPQEISTVASHAYRKGKLYRRRVNNEGKGVRFRYAATFTSAMADLGYEYNAKGKPLRGAEQVNQSAEPVEVLLRQAMNLIVQAINQSKVQKERVLEALKGAL